MAVVGVAVISAVLWNIYGRIAGLSDANLAVQQQLAQLSSNDADIQNRIDELTGLLHTQAETERLLEDVLVGGFASEDQKTAALTLYLKPKLYQESNTAYVSVKNPYTGYSELLKCSWNGVHYSLRHSLEMKDGYHMEGSALNSAANALLPKVAVKTPQLNEGDQLTLQIEAETVNGGAEVQHYVTELDRIDYKE